MVPIAACQTCNRLGNAFCLKIALTRVASIMTGAWRGITVTAGLYIALITAVTATCYHASLAPWRPVVVESQKTLRSAPSPVR